MHQLLSNFLIGKWLQWKTKSMIHQVNFKPLNTNLFRFFWRQKLEDHVKLVHVLGKVDFPCCVNWLLREVPRYTDLSFRDTINHNVHMNYFKSLSSKSDSVSLSNLFVRAWLFENSSLLNWLAVLSTFWKSFFWTLSQICQYWSNWTKLLKKL